ncbi:MAG: hypothetical protein M1308_18215, partial [Actinobacteria bacterium]|nr:hypothetical protein [Actinomycetota bacterium]
IKFVKTELMHFLLPYIAGFAFRVAVIGHADRNIEREQFWIPKRSEHLISRNLGQDFVPAVHRQSTPDVFYVSCIRCNPLPDRLKDHQSKCTCRPYDLPSLWFQLSPRYTGSSS